MGLEVPLWRALSVFRVAALGYSIALMISAYSRYDNAALGWVVLGVMGLWTSVTGIGYADPDRRRWPLLLADMAVAALCLGATKFVIPAALLKAGSPTVPTAWVAGAVLAWALTWGRHWAAVAALTLGAVDVWVRGTITQATVNGAALLLLAGVIVGYVVRLMATSEERLQRAIRMEAATRERERLARSIHDSVLQVLALVQRRGTELGGEAAELGRLAGEQEATLRTLVGIRDTEPVHDSGSTVDLRALLGRLASAQVAVSAPATPVWLSPPVAEETAAAVGSALDNVRAHCPPETRAWVLIEDEPAAVTVTVRDDGPGIPDGRLAEAEAGGRLGVAQALRGRIRDLGGTVDITSVAGEGTEVELRVPRRPGATRDTGLA